MKLPLLFKYILIIFLAISTLPSYGQRKKINMSEHDQKPYYFGITFGMNFSGYRIKYNQDFVDYDTFTSIQPSFKPGFNLGLMGNLKLSNFIDLRFVQSLSFLEKNIVTTFSN